MVELAAVAGKAALIRTVHQEAEAVVHQTAPLPTVLKVDQAEEEVARVQVKVKAVPGNNRY